MVDFFCPSLFAPLLSFLFLYPIIFFYFFPKKHRLLCNCVLCGYLSWEMLLLYMIWICVLLHFILSTFNQNSHISPVPFPLLWSLLVPCIAPFYFLYSNLKQVTNVTVISFSLFTWLMLKITKIHIQTVSFFLVLHFPK